MELNGWSSPQMLTRYGASARSARARRTYDRIMTDKKSGKAGVVLRVWAGHAHRRSPVGVNAPQSLSARASFLGLPSRRRGAACREGALSARLSVVSVAGTARRSRRCERARR
jgi:hypothetical protein